MIQTTITAIFKSSNLKGIQKCLNNFFYKYALIWLKVLIDGKGKYEKEGMTFVQAIVNVKYNRTKMRPKEQES